MEGVLLIGLFQLWKSVQRYECQGMGTMQQKRVTFPYSLLKYISQNEIVKAMDNRIILEYRCNGMPSQHYFCSIII